MSVSVNRNRSTLAAFLLLLAGIVPSSCLLIAEEIEGLPSPYSARTEAIAPILESIPGLRLQSFKRLRFSSDADESAFALRMHNEPDILSLSMSEYVDLARRGKLADLSPVFLKLGPVNQDGPTDIVGWLPLRDAGQAVSSMLIRDSLLFGLPGRKRIHGVLARRSAFTGGVHGRAGVGIPNREFSFACMQGAARCLTVSYSAERR